MSDSNSRPRSIERGIVLAAMPSYYRLAMPLSGKQRKHATDLNGSESDLDDIRQQSLQLQDLPADRRRQQFITFCENVVELVERDVMRPVDAAQFMCDAVKYGDLSLDDLTTSSIIDRACLVDIGSRSHLAGDLNENWKALTKLIRSA